MTRKLIDQSNGGGDRLQTVLGLICTVAALIIAAYIVKQRAGPEQAKPELVTGWRSYADGGHWLGRGHTDTTIVVFSDYQCVHCKRLWFSLDSLLSSGRDVTIIYRHFFYESAHPSARAAALSAECAADQDRFAEYHRLLFAEQDSLGTVSWERLARIAGVRDLARFNQCLDQQLGDGAILADRKAGEKLGVQATPTFLINHHKWMGGVGSARLARMIEDVRER